MTITHILMAELHKSVIDSRPVPCLCTTYWLLVAIFHSIVIQFLLTDVAAGVNLSAVLKICCST